MKGKKGDLTDHVMGIIIAAICLILLIGLAVLIYKAIINSDYKNAGKALELVETKINAISDGESTTFFVQSPCKGDDTKTCSWRLVSWDKDSLTRPDRCYFESCICICKLDTSIFTFKSYERNVIDSCQASKTGICKKVAIDYLEVTEVQEHSNNYAVSFTKPLNSVLVSKRSDRVFITHLLEVAS